MINKNKNIKYGYFVNINSECNITHQMETDLMWHGSYLSALISSDSIQSNNIFKFSYSGMSDVSKVFNKSNIGSVINFLIVDGELSNDILYYIYTTQLKEKYDREKYIWGIRIVELSVRINDIADIEIFKINMNNWFDLVMVAADLPGRYKFIHKIYEYQS